jgi:predicted membrane protein
MLPHIDKLFAHGYVDLNTSANMDVILFWVGWTLNIPGFAGALFSMPGTVKVMNLLGKYLPKRFVRKYESRNIQVNVEGDYGEMWNQVTKEEPPIYSLGVTSRVK